MLSFLEMIGAWLRALPAPTEHWAAILSAWAWPISALLIVYALRKPVKAAADRLAKRFEKDNIELGNWLKVSSDTSITTLDQDAVTEESGTPEAADVKLVEGLLEYAGESDEKAMALLRWIESHAGLLVDPEDFLTEPQFAEQRQLAYKTLVEGKSNG